MADILLTVHFLSSNLLWARKHMALPTWLYCAKNRPTPEFLKLSRKIYDIKQDQHTKRAITQIDWDQLCLIFMDEKMKANFNQLAKCVFLGIVLVCTVRFDA